ncbi:flavodoxin domain-containing protein [Clostridium omnivorum]|uniref:Metallo-beta-lactamase/flavodoxin domain-containing protein n=1 Tax=Clostridium omnivorum TaxID=1604902 RepID=A0ABQ5N5I0_9CLOT|nr:flavodoxin domain-containing protein [Clostridium sp. E14]GLC30494.1 metallo-beta-lactamase/flavodoxin domain-containing protein [Clostridium sp. E14]
MKELRKGVYWVGASDWKVRYFHGNELSTHRGSTYNSYLIKDEKTVLIDTVWEPLTDRFLENLSEVVDIKKIDYVVMNHMEPDHSGALPTIMEYIPDATIIVSKRGVETIKEYYHKDWKLKVVNQGDKLSIGKNELTFIEASMLHWPDSMFTYLSGENILFSNDAFGQHFASSEIFNDLVDEAEVYQEAIKYYANILTPFSNFVTRKINQLKELNLPVEMIAPSHGVIWRKDPMSIVEKYYEWAQGKSEKSVVIIYNSMWGATHKMAEFIAKGLGMAGVEYKIFNTATADRNDILAEVFKSKGVILGSSTVNNGLLTSLMPVIEDLIGLKFINKVGAAFGSYGWSGESPKLLSEYLTKAKIEVIQEGLKAKYMPDTEELDKCIEFGKNFGETMLSKFND